MAEPKGAAGKAFRAFRDAGLSPQEAFNKMKGQASSMSMSKRKASPRPMPKGRAAKKFRLAREAGKSPRDAFAMVKRTEAKRGKKDAIVRRASKPRQSKVRFLGGHEKA